MSAVFSVGNSPLGESASLPHRKPSVTPYSAKPSASEFAAAVAEADGGVGGLGEIACMGEEAKSAGLPSVLLNLSEAAGFCGQGEEAESQALVLGAESQMLGAGGDSKTSAAFETALTVAASGFGLVWG